MPLICCLPFSWQQFLTLLTDHCTRRTAENWEQYTRTIYTIIIQQWPFMQASPGKLAAELSETITQCTTFTVHKLLTRTPNLPSSGSYSTSSYNTRRNPNAPPSLSSNFSHALPIFPPQAPILPPAIILGGTPMHHLHCPQTSHTHSQSSLLRLLFYLQL